MTNKRIITIYLLISLFEALLMTLTSAIYVTFLLERGLNLFEVNLVNFLYMITVFILEIPTGAVADIWGRKFSSVLSGVFSGMGFLIYSLADTFLGFVFAEIIIALGTSLTSGALKAWVVDSLHFYNWNGGFKKVFFLEGRVINLARMFGGLIGAFLGIKDLSIPFAVTGVGYWLLAFFSYVVMKERYFQKKTGQFKKFLKDFKGVIKSSLIYGFQNDIIFLIVTIAAIFSLSFQPLNMYWQPRFKSALSGNQYFGFIWIGIIVFVMIGNELTKWMFVDTKKPRLIYLLIGLSVGLSIILSGAIPVFRVALICFFLHEAVRGFYETYNNAVLQENIPSDKRATISSFVSMIKAGAASLGLVIGGLAAKIFGIPASWILSGLVILIFLPLSLVKKTAHY